MQVQLALDDQPTFRRDKMDHELCEFYQIVTRRMKSKELGRLNDSMFYEVADCTHPDYNRTLGELPCKGDKAQCVLTRS